MSVPSPLVAICAPIANVRVGAISRSEDVLVATVRAGEIAGVVVGLGAEGGPATRIGEHQRAVAIDVFVIVAVIEPLALAYVVVTLRAGIELDKLARVALLLPIALAQFRPQELATTFFA
jgi:hypothetical protein